jgi:hypothetical protein
MPRPKNGYINAAGHPVPGTHDPISRYMDQTALKFWAYKRGQQGLPLFDRAAIDIGSAVHGMAELDLKGRPDREIEAYAHDRLVAPDHLRKAFASFGQFREWRQQCQVRAIAQEVSLVSETHQFGGTPDTIAMVGNRVGLLEFKTSPKPYPDHLIAMAAHGRLWEETHPQHKLDGGFHLIILPKDGTAFQHHAYEDLSLQWRIFTLWLEAFRLEKAEKVEKVAPPFVAPTVEMRRAAAKACDAAKAWEPAPASAAKPPRRAPRARAVPTGVASTLAAAAPASMAEMLRSYGHVKEYNA